VADVLLAFDLLDRQIVDRDGQPVGKVDDLELTADDDGGWQVTALLVGQQVLGRRLGGWLGTMMESVARRLEPTPSTGPIRIPYDLVASVESAVTLSVRRELLADPPLESWLRDHFVGRIPGASHES
jgi:sporulation protein YlmC with PRC-barrel domain